MNNPRILITGATGFIGSHLTEYCVKKGFSVVAFDRYNTGNSWGWLENSEYRNDFEVVLGDIRDFDSVSRVMQGCVAVFHLAAVIGIPYSYISPLAYIRTNIEGTYNVLESARQYELEQVLVTSTSETYGTAQYVPMDENHPSVGQSPYSATKIAADQLAISYYRSFGLPVKIVRPFNTYGPRQSPRAVIPTVITQILSEADSIKLGNLTPTRDLTFVEDTCSGFLEIFNSNKFHGEVTNIGMNKEISIGDLVSMISELMDADIDIEGDSMRARPEASEVDRLRCDNQKLTNNTNWKPNHDIKTGLFETIKWFKSLDQKFKSDHYHV